jgi:hypothetical protein
MREEFAVPIYRLLQNSAFEPELIAVMTGAFEDACRELRLASRTDARRDIVAKRIIEAAQTGERDRRRLAQSAVEAIGE